MKKKAPKCIASVFLLTITLAPSATADGGGFDPPYLPLEFHDAFLYSYSILNKTLMNNHITTDSIPDLKEHREINKDDLINLYAFMNKSIKKTQLEGELSLDEDKIVFEPKKKNYFIDEDFFIRDAKIIYDGVFILTEVHFKGENTFSYWYYSEETDIFIELIKNWLVFEKKFKEGEIESYIYFVQEIYTWEFKVRDEEDEEGYVYISFLLEPELYQDDEALVEYLKSWEVSELEYEDSSISVHFRFFDTYYHFYDDWSLYYNEICSLIPIAIEYIQMKNITRQIEKDLGEMERQNIDILSNIDGYHDFYGVYGNNKSRLRVMTKFLNLASQELNNYDYKSTLEKLSLADYGVDYDLDLQVADLQHRIASLDRDYEIEMRIRETRDSIEYNQKMVALTLLILVFTIVLIVFSIYTNTQFAKAVSRLGVNLQEFSEINTSLKRSIDDSREILTENIEKITEKTENLDNKLTNFEKKHGGPNKKKKNSS
ncbi:MAG: hypothetical protein HXS54_05790 [Theionarchaea archaeon]|nr:hypothetical protein [Theionarchaea archaeon]